MRLGLIIKRLLVLALFLSPLTALGQECREEHNPYSSVRYITACGVTMHLSMEGGYATHNLTQLRAFDELEEVRCRWNLPSDSPILCYRAYLAFPSFFGWFYPSFMRSHLPEGFPGDSIPLSRRLR